MQNLLNQDKGVSLYIWCLVVYIFFIHIESISVLESFGTVAKLLAIGVAVLAAISIMVNRQIIVVGKAELLLVTFFLWCCATVWWSVDENAAMERLLSVFMLVFFTILAGFRGFNEREIKVLIQATYYSGSALALYILTLGEAFHEQVNRISLSGTDPNHLSGCLLLAVAIGLSGVFENSGKSIATRLVYFATLGMIVGAIVMTGSRGGFLGLFILVLAYFVFTQRYVWVIGLTVTFVCILLLLWQDPTSRFSGEMALNSGGAGRVDIWKVGLKVLEENWFIGGGLANFNELYTLSALQTSTGFAVGVHRAPHNTIIGMTSEVGIIGLALFIGSIYCLIQRYSDFCDNERIVLWSALVGIAISGMFLDMLYMKYLWLVLLLLYGIQRQEILKAETA
ncbi:MAG TPA: O-antigen ligase family protein [Patescibacteria group bacterium]|nr:O-antigen ligase family protein [Patescibacteria group bacterium]